MSITKSKGSITDPHNESHKLQIHREVVAWDKKYEGFSGKYRFNPFHLTSLTPKPTQVDPSKQGNVHYSATIYRDPTEEAFSSKYISKTIITNRMTPGSKYLVPKTAAQEIGWYHSPMTLRASSAAWHFRPKTSCYETYFATEFFKSSGASPFKSSHKR